MKRTTTKAKATTIKAKAIKAKTAKIAPPKHPRMVLYIRVSTEKQADEGHSLEAQEAKLKKYAEVHDYIIAGTEVDAGISGGSLARPGMQSALAMLDAGEADGIMVVKLDRLTRSLRDLFDLTDRYFSKGKILCSVAEHFDTSSAMGRFFLNMMGLLGQMEREQASERTKATFAHMRTAGRKTGGSIPIGFIRVGEKPYHLVPDPEWERARAIVAEAGDASNGEVGRRLAAAGFFPNEGATTWARNQVGRYRKSLAERVVA